MEYDSFEQKVLMITEFGYPEALVAETLRFLGNNADETVLHLMELSKTKQNGADYDSIIDSGNDSNAKRNNYKNISTIIKKHPDVVNAVLNEMGQFNPALIKLISDKKKLETQTVTNLSVKKNLFSLDCDKFSANIGYPGKTLSRHSMETQSAPLSEDFSFPTSLSVPGPSNSTIPKSNYNWFDFKPSTSGTVKEKSADFSENDQTSVDKLIKLGYPHVAKNLAYYMSKNKEAAEELLRKHEATD